MRKHAILLYLAAFAFLIPAEVLARQGSPAPQTPPSSQPPAQNQQSVNPQSNQRPVTPQPNQSNVNPSTVQGNLRVQPGTVSGQMVVEPGMTTFGGINQTPWFSSAEVQAQLNLTPDQLARLNQLYAQDFNRFQLNQSQIGVNDPQRQLRMQELSDAFVTDFSRASGDVLNQQQSARFAQLWTQYRGLSVFNDRRIQEQLHLTPRQLEQIRRLEQDYDRQWASFTRDTSASATAVNTRFTNLRREYSNRVNAVLTPDQRTMLNTMTGEPFVWRVR